MILSSFLSIYPIGGKYGYSRDFTAGRRKPVKPASRDQGPRGGGARAGGRDVSSSSQQMPREAVQALMDALQGPEAPTAAPSCRWPKFHLIF